MQHYAGELGTFDYNEFSWEIRHFDGKDCLHWIGDKQKCNLPKGCISCRLMFYQCTLSGWFEFGDFDTSQVEDMHGMFRETRFSLGMSLGDKFDTSAVKDMSGMFAGAFITSSFDFGDKFDTSNVQNMDGMFAEAAIMHDLNVGKLFRTSKDVTMNGMFIDCMIKGKVSFPESFCLGDKHDRIFEGCSVCACGSLTKHDPYKVIDNWTGRTTSKDRIDEVEPTYDFSKILDVPAVTLRFCEAKSEFDTIVEKYCRNGGYFV